MRMKKFLTFLLTLAMVVSLLPATAFAANNTATTMRLAKTQGTVAVTNATGKKVKQTSNMKLYNGYKLKTGAKSYAWISLDNTKVAKLDANSVVSVQKSGQKLTLYLSSGNLFFNVKESLKQGEAFHIKTSTMTTGIRGTSGCVRVINPRVSEIHLLTGRIEVFAEHPELHLTKSEVLTAGTMATSLIDQEAMALTGEQVEIIVKELDENRVCGNCATEIAADPDLQERIEAETDLDVEEIVDNAEEKLAEDEQAAEEKQAAIDEEVANQVLPEDVDPYFEEEKSSGGGGGSSSSAVVDSNTVYEWDKLIEKINEFNAGTEDMTITLGENLPNAEDLARGTGVLDALPDVDNGNGNTLTLNLSDYMLGLTETWTNQSDLIITNNDGKIGLLSDHGYGSGNVTIDNYGTLTLKNGTILTYGGNHAVQNGDGAVFRMSSGAIGCGWLLVDDVSEELVYSVDALDTEYSMAVNNLSGGTVEISGGTIETHYGIGDNNTTADSGDVTITGGTFLVPSTGYAVTSAGNVKISGGTVTAEGLDPIILIEEDGNLDITGGTFHSGGILIQNDAGTFSMTGGTINMEPENGTANSQVFAYYDARRGTATFGGNAKIVLNVTGTSFSGLEDRMAAFGISSNYSTLTMTGGTIEVNGSSSVSGVNVYSGTFEQTGGTIKVNSAEGCGVYSEGEITLSGGAISAAAGTAVEAADGTVTLAEGAKITATGDANAVRITNETSTEVTRPIKADISAEKFTAGDEDNADTNGLFYPMLDFLHEDANSTGTLWDRYGEVYDVKSLNHWIGVFNDGNEDMTLTFADDIIHEAGSLAEVENTEHTLTLNLGSYTFALKGTGFANRGLLEITGDEGAKIQLAEGETASYLLRNYGKMTVDGVELVVSENATGIMAQNIVSEIGENTVTVQNCQIDATAAGATGIEIVNLGTNVPVLDFSSSNMTVGNGTDTTAVGIQTRGGDVTITGTGTKITVNSGTGILADDNGNGIDGIVNGNGGTMAVSGSATGIAVADGGNVTMDGMAMTLQDVDGATAVSVAAGGGFEGKSKSITFYSPAVNSIGIHVAADAEASLNGMSVFSNSTANTGLKMVYLDGTADEMSTLNIVGDSWIFSEEDGYAVYSKYSTVNMSAGMLANRSAPGYGIYAENSAVNITGGNIGMSSGGSSTDANYNIYLVNSAFTMDGGAIEAVASIASNRMKLQCLYAENSTLNLMRGTITAKNNASPISVTNDTDITLGSSMVVKHDTTDILEIRETDTGLYGVVGPEDGYYTLVDASAVPSPADWFITQVETFNAGTTDMVIVLPEAIDLTTATKTMPAIGTAGDDKALTIDLNGQTLTLKEMMSNQTILTVTDTSGGGKVTGKSGITMNTLINSSGTLYWEGGTLEVTTDQTYGIRNANELYLYGGTIRFTDASDVSGTKAAITTAMGTVYMYGGTVEISETGTAGSVVGLQNSGSAVLNLYGGTINVESDSAYGVSNIGEMLVSETEDGIPIINANADGSYGILNSGGDLTYNAGAAIATVSGATAVVNNNGATIALNGGSITGNVSGATALQNSETISGTVGTTIQAVDSAKVCVGTLPEGYQVSDAADAISGYYYLESTTAIVSVSTWGAFRTAITDFNAQSDARTIVLSADIDPTAQDLTDYPVPATGLAIGNGTANDLTIDLGTYTLALPTTLATSSSSGLVITGTTGSITTGTEWDDSAYLLNNYTNMTLAGGTIEVPHGVVGVNNTGTFEMTDGAMDITYSTGIQNTNKVTLSGGEITLVEDNTNYSDGGLDPIGYMAYAGSGSMATLELNGTDITIEQGILYYNNDGSESIISPPAGVYNDTGATATFTKGTVSVGSGVGISNHGTLTMKGTASVEVEEAATAVEDAATGIESFGGTFEMTSDTAEVTVTAGTGLKLGAATTLKYGNITADGTAVAVESYTADVTMTDDMTVRAADVNNVYILGSGGAYPEGYEVSDTADGGYYYMVPAL